MLDIFLPFLESLSALHGQGIVHYGISPETIFVDKHCKLYLLGFDTQTGRTLKSDLDVELFDGFSAPEQYSLKNLLGTWTDVYSIASVLYYCFTSIRPPHAIDRHKRDTIVPCHNINNNIPRSVSLTLEKAMNISIDTRTQTVEKLIHGITGANKPNVLEKLTSAKDLTPMHKNRNTEKNVAEKVTYKQFPYMLVSTIVTTVILCFCGVFLFRSLFGPQLDTFVEKNFGGHHTSIKHEDIKGNVPDFVGQKFSDVKSNKENRDLFTFEEKYEYNEEFDEGVIVSQTPDSSALIANTYKISFVISKGSQYTTVPDIISMNMAQAMTALTNAGITNFKFIQVEETGYSSGEVIICMPAVNSRFNKQTDYLEVICQK